MNEEQSRPGEIEQMLGILRSACERLGSVQDKLEGVASLPDKLDNLKDWLTALEKKIDKSADAHESLQTRYLEQSHKHELEIQAIQLRLKNYETTVKKVEELDKKVFAYALLGTVAGAIVTALFTGLPAWRENDPPQKTSAIITSELQRGQG